MDISDFLEGEALDSSFPLPLHTPFTDGMARDAGITSPQLTQLTGAGLLRRPIKGVYVANVLPDSLELRAHCLKLVMPDDCVVVDRHAGWYEAICGLDAMFRLGAFTREEFLAGIERFAGMRWVRTLRVIGPLADGRSQRTGSMEWPLRSRSGYAVCSSPSWISQTRI